MEKARVCVCYSSQKACLQIWLSSVLLLSNTCSNAAITGAAACFLSTFVLSDALLPAAALSPDEVSSPLGFMLVGLVSRLSFVVVELRDAENVSKTSLTCIEGRNLEIKEQIIRKTNDVKCK